MSDKDGLKYVLGRLMGMAAKVMKTRLDENLATSGLDLRAEHFILLGHIAESEGANQQQFTHIMFHDKTATTRWIDQLEQKNLVVRVPDKQDRRQNLIYLTGAGKSLAPKMLEIALLTECQALEGIDPK